MDPASKIGNKDIMFPLEMMYDNIWIDRLDYDREEMECQLLLNNNMKEVLVESCKKIEVQHTKVTPKPKLEEQVFNEDSLSSNGFVSQKDFNDLKSAFMNLTQTVDTLITENQKLKNRFANNELQIKNIKKTNEGRGNENKAKITAINKRLQKVEKKLVEKQNQNNVLSLSGVNFEQMLAVCNRGNKTNLDLIRSLEKSQVEETQKFDSAMNSLRSYLQHKDGTYSQNFEKLKEDLEQVIQNKTQGISALKETVQKHKQLGEEAHNRLKKRIEQIEKDRGNNLTTGDRSIFDSRSDSYASSLNSIHDEKPRYEFNKATNTLVGSELIPPTAWRNPMDLGQAYWMDINGSKKATLPTVGSKSTSKSWYEASSNLSSDESYKKHEEPVVPDSKAADSTVNHNELRNGMTLLLSKQPDHCLPVSDVRAKYPQVVGKPFPVKNQIRKTIQKHCENIRSLGVTSNATFFLLDQENTPHHILLVQCLDILYDQRNFTANIKDILDNLYSYYQCSIHKKKIQQTVGKYPNYLESGKDGRITMTPFARITMLRHLMVSLLKHRQRIGMCSIGNMISRSFSLDHYNQTGMRGLLNAFGQDVISITGDRERQMVELGPQGKVYLDMTNLLESNAGAILVEGLHDKFKELFGKDLFQAHPGFTNIEEFVAMFPTSFRLYGADSKKTMVLVKYTTTWQWIVQPAPDLKNLVALDCEMVAVRMPGTRVQISRAARCSIVDYNMKVLYNKFFKPDEHIVDYRTKYSGISKSKLENAIPFRTARQEILNVIKDKIVVGHSLSNDFDSLRVHWPESNRRDLATCSLLSKDIRSLKKLTEEFLGRKIQTGSHCSLEDAIATMELYRLVHEKWEGGIST